MKALFKKSQFVHLDLDSVDNDLPAEIEYWIMLIFEVRFFR